MEDISNNLDPAQYGNQAGTSTEHLLIRMMDQILGQLDQNPKSSAVIAAVVDWSSAFDQQDPTLAVEKYLRLGLRHSVVPVIVSYLTGRRMQTKYNGALSSTYSLPSGHSQGTLMGGLGYTVGSDDSVESVDFDNKYCWVDDLSILELVAMADLLCEYNFKQHIAADIGIEEQFIPASSLKTQENLNNIADWTKENLHVLNEDKCKYMVFSRSNKEVETRLKINGKIMDRIEETKLLGVWLSTYLDWTRNTMEVCRKAYMRVGMLTKLKYVGTSRKDLINIYMLFIRSVLEYCSTVYHSTLTKEQAASIERVQKVCLRVILDEDYHSYEQALRTTELDTLENRRESKCLKFALKCLDHPIHHKMFPINRNENNLSYDLRSTEKFHVNKA